MADAVMTATEKCTATTKVLPPLSPLCKQAPIANNCKLMQQQLLLICVNHTRNFFEDLLALGKICSRNAVLANKLVLQHPTCHCADDHIYKRAAGELS